MARDARTRNRITAMLALVFLCSMAAADGLDSPDRQDTSAALYRLFGQYGRVFPTASLPLSRASLARSFQLLEGAPGDAGDQAEVSAFVQSFQREDVPSIGISLDAEYQHFFRPADEALVVGDMGQLLEVLDPLVLLRLSSQLNNSTVLVIAAEVRREYNIGVIDSNLFPSVPGNPIAIENNDITEGYLRSAAGPFELTFGRQEVHIGPSPVNSLMVSQRIPFLDGLNLKGHFGQLGMTLVISTLENRQATPDVTPVLPDYDFGKTVILFNTHYFEYNFGSVRLGIGGQYLVVRPQNAFQLADFFPVISWHQTNIVPNNLSLLMDFSWVPVKGLTLYGQGGMDDISLSFAGVADGDIPSIPAFLLGATWEGRLDAWILHGWVETGYTHYLWGNFDDTASMARAIYRMDTDGPRRFVPLTSPYGPGSIWATASFSASTPWHLDTGVRVQYVAKNPLADLTSLSYGVSSAVASSPLSHWVQIALSARWTPFQFMWLSAVPEFDVRDGKAWFALTLSGGITLDAKVAL
jgi:hypothetical protein